MVHVQDSLIELHLLNLNTGMQGTYSFRAAGGICLGMYWTSFSS